jgi:putative membrane protein
VARRDSKSHLKLHFRVRPFLMRWVVSALTLAITVLVVPHIFFSGEYRILSWILISGVFGLLIAFIKPLFQLVLLPLIFVSYGLVIVLINTVILFLLSAVFPARFHVEFLLWGIVGGVVSGLIYTLLENVFGLSPPIMTAAPPDVQHEIDEGDPGLVESGILKVARHGSTAPTAPTASSEEAPGQAAVAAAVLETVGAGDAAVTNGDGDADTVPTATAPDEEDPT